MIRTLKKLPIPIILLALLVVPAILTTARVAMVATAPPSSTCEVQPGGVITPAMAEGFRAYWPLYTAIAAAEETDAILVAPVHFREHFGRDNPRNGQGIFQLYSLVKSGAAHFPGTSGAPVSDDEFIRQGRLAVQALKAKAGSRFGPTPEDTTVKKSYYGYNGRNSFYASQARPGEGPWDGSPYVSNIPGVRELLMYTRDGGGPKTVDHRPGAWPIYDELRQQCLTTPAPPGQTPTVESPTGGVEYASPIPIPGSDGQFAANWQPLQFGREWVFIVGAMLLVAPIAWVIRIRGAFSPYGILFTTANASLALAVALTGERLSQGGWSYAAIWHNFASIPSAMVDWVTYPPRVSAIRSIVLIASLLVLVITAVLAKTGGLSGVAKAAQVVRPILAGATGLARQSLRWPYAWLLLASLVSLFYTASRLNSVMWFIVAWAVGVLGNYVAFRLNIGSSRVVT